MGKILLTTKHKLSNCMSLGDRKDLFDFWKIEIDALKNSDKRENKNNLDVIKEAASMVGVKIEYIGGENLILNSNGESVISYADYALALVDVIESGKYIKERISVVSK